MEVIAGFIIFIYLFIRTDHLIVQWDKFAQFFAFMCFVLMIKAALNGGVTGASVPDINPAFFTLVFWEDSWFMCPIYYAFYKWGRNKYTILLAICLSLWFAHGHLYHGYVGAAITLLYPYFISYRYAKKTSIGTVMACHVLYDLMLYYSLVILK